MASEQATIPTAETTPATLVYDLQADAVARLRQLHPAFEPKTAREMGVPPDATLADMARAADLPLTAVMAAAKGVIGVPELCGCGSCGGGNA